MELSKKDRAYLKRLAHGFDAIVHVGKQGVTDAVIASVDDALTANELIKLRFVDKKTEKEALLETIAARTECEVVDTIGHVAILFRQNDDEAKRKIELHNG